jgi:anti-sigma B factor antagonist
MSQVECEELRGALVARPTSSRLDAFAAPTFRSELVAVARGRSLVVLTMEHVSFVDSSGLGSIVSVLKSLAEGGQLRLVGVGDSLAALLRLTRLDRVFSSYATIDDAIRG